MQTVTVRLTPGADLKHETERVQQQHDITAGFIVSCVGGLRNVCVRMAGVQPNKQDIRSYQGHFEIVSLVGTISPDGVHIHVSFSDQEGAVLGGHLKEGTVVDPTAELVVGYDKTLRFRRELDSATGFPELLVEDV